jgi:hypothetical protein
MHRFSLPVVVGLAWLLAGCASAQWHTYTQQKTPPNAVGATLASSGHPLTCRVEAPTGSLLRKKECHSQSEWTRIDSASENNFNMEAAHSAAATSNYGNGPSMGAH